MGNEAAATVFGKADFMTLLKSDLGLDLVFIKEGGPSVRVSLDWLQVAELTQRIDAFGDEALTMMQIGLDPYCKQHRSDFELAGLLACDTPKKAD